MMDSQDVLDVIAVLEDAGASQLWLDGGWGVDALLGEQHRDHADADIVVRVEELERVVAALAEVGFAVTLDHRPTRLELMDRSGRVIDVHPVRFDANGDAWQSGAAAGGGDVRYPADSFTYGWIAGRRVSCIGPELQIQHHMGFEPSAQSRADMQRIHERFSVPLPELYR